MKNNCIGGVIIDTYTVKEGLGTFTIPEIVNSDVPTKKDPVFYNTHQEINRDLSVLCARAYFEDTSFEEYIISEPFCGTGIRGIRYLIEIPHITKVILSDISLKAVEMATKNIQLLGNNHREKIQIYQEEANTFLNVLRTKNLTPTFTDIDPYGTPIPFIQNAVRNLKHKGILGCTATDLTVLTGIYKKKLNYLYGVTSFEVRAHNFHEMALRSLLGGIERQALTQGCSIEPILSFYYRHYIRVMGIKRRGVNYALGNLGFIKICKKCRTRVVEPLEMGNFICEYCNSSESFTIGPLFIGDITKESILERIENDRYLETLKKNKKITKLILLQKKEIKVKIPWSYDLPILSKELRISEPSVESVEEKLNEKGFKFAKTHYSGQTIKTDAKYPEILQVLRDIAL